MPSPGQARGQMLRPDLIRNHCYIDGAWLAAASGETITVIDPFTGSCIGDVPSLAAGEIDDAIQAADLAFVEWSRRNPRERGRLLRRWHDLVLSHAEDLACLITLENGKPLKEARGEIAYGAAFIELYAEEAGRAWGETIPAPTPGRRLLVEREAVGVCGVITPWNFPVAMLTRKLAPALAAGCTVVAKPASETPFSALALAVLAEEAGIPAGVINIVTGQPVMVGERLTGSPIVRKISFTGSTRVGAQLMAASAGTIKRLSLELGGNAPLLIFDDANLSVAVETAMVAKFRNSGQSCIAANRIYVQQGLHDAFVGAFSKRVAALTSGDGFDPATDIGPLISEAAVARVDRHILDATNGGARILNGGLSGEGRMCRPTLLCDVATDALVTQEETFGPLAAVIRFDTIEQGIQLANDTPFGLAAYLCSSSPATISRVGRALESGMVGINTGLISTAFAPFGGVKMSGLGREGSHHGLNEYLNLKYLCEAEL
ncbi:Glutarate-semialdehyde dehydrogenase [Brevundimonas subvibrioides]|uniref:NAD-dependent succinate-semialdehyde dehydrogenase n=1 Tax=Brevundimonas subvibrioides TaxID=74313 RepID=UPI003A785A01